jgi:hypothetical protein
VGLLQRDPGDVVPEKIDALAPPGRGRLDRQFMRQAILPRRVARPQANEVVAQRNKFAVEILR